MTAEVTDLEQTRKAKANIAAHLALAGLSMSPMLGGGYRISKEPNWSIDVPDLVAAAEFALRYGAMPRQSN